MQAWHEWVVELLRAVADLALRSEGEVRPLLVAGEGERPLLYAELRPFPKGRYHDALIELMALALPLGADRVAVGMTGRLWSLDDPIPPVVGGVGDLRQRALVLELIDGHRRAVTNRTLLVPFDLRDGEVVWDEPSDPGPGEGWIPAALRVLVEGRQELAVDLAQIRDQAVRCLALGHRLVLLGPVADRLGLDAVPLP